MRVAITGANGYLGKIISKHLIESGHTIVAGTRAPKKLNSNNKISYRKYDLSFTQEQCNEFTKGCDAVIHLAFQKKEKNINAREINKTGTLNLFNSTKDLKYKIYFSTMSAHQDAISDYGISKLEIEKELKNLHILKCGLVLSNTGGLYGELKKIISKSPIIPAIAGGNQAIHTLYYQDLNLCIDKILNQKIEKGNYLCGEKESITMKKLYLEIAKSLDKKIALIPIPYWIVEIAFKFIDLLPINISSENLKGLKSLKSFNNQNFFPNINFKNFSESLLAL